MSPDHAVPTSNLCHDHRERPVPEVSRCTCRCMGPARRARDGPHGGSGRTPSVEHRQPQTRNSARRPRIGFSRASAKARERQRLGVRRRRRRSPPSIHVLAIHRGTSLRGLATHWAHNLEVEGSKPATTGVPKYGQNIANLPSRSRVCRVLATHFRRLQGSPDVFDRAKRPLPLQCRAAQRQHAVVMWTFAHLGHVTSAGGAR